MQTMHVLGERYIACGKQRGTFRLEGTPGNALGAYLDGATIEVFGNAQDATGDTMNDGQIIVHGNTGDAAGYAMRGGVILVHGDAGYRAGIHMKAYQEKSPLLVIGGRCGSFLGEYQAGGTILVLGIGCEGKRPMGDFCGTGMHGGQIVVRSDERPEGLPPQVEVCEATAADMQKIHPFICDFALKFNENLGILESGRFWVLTPSTRNPYKQLYVNN